MSSDGETGESIVDVAAILRTCDGSDRNSFHPDFGCLMSVDEYSHTSIVQWLSIVVKVDKYRHAHCLFEEGLKDRGSRVGNDEELSSRG